jgi:hypothetical protein
MKPTDQACSNYFPVNFTTGKQTIEMEDGATLEPEQLIFNNNAD